MHSETIAVYLLEEFTPLLLVLSECLQYSKWFLRSGPVRLWLSCSLLLGYPFCFWVVWPFSLSRYYWPRLAGALFSFLLFFYFLLSFFLFFFSVFLSFALSFFLAFSLSFFLSSAFQFWPVADLGWRFFRFGFGFLDGCFNSCFFMCKGCFDLLLCWCVRWLLIEIPERVSSQRKAFVSVQWQVGVVAERKIRVMEQFFREKDLNRKGRYLSEVMGWGWRVGGREAGRRGSEGGRESGREEGRKGEGEGGSERWRRIEEEKRVLKVVVENWRARRQGWLAISRLWIGYKNYFLRMWVGSFMRRAPLGGVLHDRYLVDPASSHMLVSKIKPCMSKYK